MSPLPTKEQIEHYLDGLNDVWLITSENFNDIPDLVHQLWLDVTRYGPMPNLPDRVHLPGIGDYEISPPPPPPAPEPSMSWLGGSGRWIQRNPWKASGIAAGIVGTGLLATYGPLYLKQAKAARLKIATRERRKVVVILGGDTPLALPLILELEQKGYIVIASVSTPEAGNNLEHKCQGYVRALVLDPEQPSTVPVFLRSLASTLSRRFPLVAGNPHAPANSQPYVHSVISLLTLHPSQAIHAPLESMSFPSAYVPYLQVSHIIPLQVITALLPLLRSSSPRARDDISNNDAPKSIIICLPATETHVGLPFASVRSVSAAATSRAVEILRRELEIASRSDTEEAGHSIKVVAVEVGSVASPFSDRPRLSPQDIYKVTNSWTPSERRMYGTAFAALSRQDEAPRTTSFLQTLKGFFANNPPTYGVARKHTDVTQFVSALVSVVNAGRRSPSSTSLFEPRLGLGKVGHWLRGDTFCIGAGAGTYRVASYLPSIILNALIQLPYILVSIRNALIPVQPFIAPDSLAPAPPPPVKQGETSEKSVTAPVEVESESASASGNDTGSEADVESNEGEGVEESWISLKKDMQASTTATN